MKTKIVKRYGSFVVQFTQGVQTFHIPNLEETKEHAIWQKEILDKAFDNFKKEYSDQENARLKAVVSKQDTLILAQRGMLSVFDTEEVRSYYQSNLLRIKNIESELSKLKAE